MKNNGILSALALSIVFCNMSPALASDSLNQRQQSIIAISADTSLGNLEQLKSSLNQALANGMTINEIKEVLVHCYAYTGFPRSLRALQVFIEVLKDRKSQGIEDPLGKEVSLVSDTRDKYSRGAELLEKLSGVPKDTPKVGYALFAPIIDVFLKEHLFSDVFERDILNWQERELATVSVLTALGSGVEPMLKSHSKIALRQGLTELQLLQLSEIVSKHQQRVSSK